MSGYVGMASAGISDDGWFDTGDLGHMDSEGFLFLTGRSKEVINRGGEQISPFEVEVQVVLLQSILGPSSTTSIYFGTFKYVITTSEYPFITLVA